METTCCPAYTIRLKANEFVPSKEQLRVSRRIQRYLDGTLEGKKQDEIVQKTNTSQGCTYPGFPNSSAAASIGRKDEEKSPEEQFMHILSEQIDNAVQLCIECRDLPRDPQLPRALVKKVSQNKRKRLVDGSEDLLYTSNISFHVAANLKREKSAENNFHEPESLKKKFEEQGFSIELSAEIIAERIVHSWEQLVEHPGWSARACNGHINFYSVTKKTSLDRDNQSDTSKKSPHQYESKGHNKVSEQSKVKLRKLEIKLKRSSFDPEEFALYRKYQLQVHNDTPDHVTRNSYVRFLVESPLVFVPPTGDGTVPPSGFGSFHQQYVIDGQLVAVGVVDILPKCLSSKYLFWDPDFAFLSLGKFSALQEIEWLKENQRFCPSLHCYYLGYYIHSCRKMRYKASYRPSELLCPLRYKWVSFEIVKPMLDRKKYVVLSDFSKCENGESSVLQESENLIEPQHDDLVQGDSNDILVGGDEEMVYPDSESYDEDLFPVVNDTEHVDVGEVLIGLKGFRCRFKVCRPRSVLLLGTMN
ncbi:hypothetical protein Dimus_022694 [Dionaea muscipula]